jgi:lycopene beta-cyclase
LGLQEYTILTEESGNIPMTDHPFPRRAGNRILNIGTKGGRVKPSTGYAFLRIQRDSAAIVHSLKSLGHPFHLPKESYRYKLNDSLMLQLMYRRGDRMESLFTQLFRNNSIQRLFRFLDETASVSEMLQVMASIPPTPFFLAWIKTKLLRRI